MKGFAIAGVTGVAVVIAGALLAQSAAISYLASVKPNISPDARTITEYFPGGRYSATAVTVRTLLRGAYRVQDHQIVGAPAWLASRRYDIAAKAEGTPPPLQAFLQTLLADHFKLVVHTETREQPRYALVPARSDRRLGRQLVPSDFDCEAWASSAHAPPDPSRTPNCGTRINMGVLSGKAIPMSRLAAALIPFAGRFVADQTGLAGRFDVELTWTPDRPASSDAATGDSGPSIFTALQEQLGLKLVPEKGPVEVLVVDRVREPVEE